MKKIRIKLIGTGGVGVEVINKAIESKLKGVEFCVIDTDEQALDTSNAENKIKIGFNPYRKV